MHTLPMGLFGWWRDSYRDNEYVQSFQRWNMRLLWHRLVYILIVLPPLSVALWWWEKGEIRPRDLVGIAVVSAIFWPTGFWLARRKRVSPFRWRA